MIRRVIGLLLVLVTAGALVSVARNVPAEASGRPAAPSLPVTPAAEVPVCPGPETLQVPAGATPVAAPGPVTVAGVVASPDAFALPASQEAGTRTATPPSAPEAALGPVAAGTRQFGADPAGGATPGNSAPGNSTADAGNGAAPVRVLRAQAIRAGAWRLDAAHDREVPVAAAVQWTWGTVGDLRGLATTTCEPATTDIWLVGGGTQPGRRARLLLANPGVTPAVVDVAVLGPEGPVPAPASSGVTVAPGTQKALYLDAIAPGLSVLALHVQARSGRVATTLHDSVVRGTVPGGADDVPATAPPSRRLVIPGVAIAAPAPFRGRPGGTLPLQSTAAGAVAVRVADPGGAEAVVRVHLVGPDGVVDLPGGGVMTVPAHGVADVVVTGVPDGLYSAVVEADTPVVAAAVIGRSLAGSEVAGTAAAARGGVPAAELAWSAAGRPLQADTAVALPSASTSAVTALQTPAVSMRLALAATGRPGRVVLAEVTGDAAIGPARTVEVPADRSVAVDLAPASTAVLLRADPAAGPVVGAVVLTASDVAGGLISVQPVRPGSQITGQTPTVVQDPRVGLHAVLR